MSLQNHSRMAAGLATRPARNVTTRSVTLNEEEGTFEAVISSDAPVDTVDLRYGLVGQSLDVDGMEYELPTPFVADHDRGSIDSLLGNWMDIWIERTAPYNLIVGRAKIAAGDPRAEGVLKKISQGVIRAISVQFQILEFVIVPAGESRVVNGRTITADSDKPRQHVTRWRLIEASAVVVPADSNAKIRTNPSDSQRSLITMTRFASPAIHSRNSQSEGPSLGALESALMLRLGISDPSQARVSHDGSHFRRVAPSSQTERDADHGRDFQTIPLIRIVQRAGELDGVRFQDYSPSSIMYQIHQHYQSRDGVSTGAMGDLFTNVFGAIFLDGLESVYDVTEGWTTVSENPTLKPTPRVRAESPSPGLVKRRPSGAPAEHASPSTISEVTELGDSFAAQFVIDEQDIIDNQFGNTEQIFPRLLGQAAGRLRPLRVLSELLGNPEMRDGTSLFHADHGNLLTGNALDGDGVQSAKAAMSKQTESGDELNLRARYMLVPEALERTAAKLAREVELLDGQSTPPPIVRSDSRFDNGITDPYTGTVHSGSATNWFMATDGGPHTIEVQFLAGTNGQPRIRSGFLNQGQFGMWFDIEHYVAAKALDWRGLVKCTA